MIDKNIFRAACMYRLKQAQNIRKIKKDKSVLRKIYQIIRKDNAKNILLYIPISIEINIYPLIILLRKEKKNIYVPFMEGESFRLVKYRLPLYIKKYGIKEPNNSKQFRNKKIDIAVVPIIGMDVARKRVGFGKGMYDRFFEREYKNINKVVFVARVLCYSKKVITNHYDIKGDIIITP